MSEADQDRPRLLLLSSRVRGKVLIGIINPALEELSNIAPEMAEEIGDCAVMLAQFDVTCLGGMIDRLKRIWEEAGV